MFPRRIVIATPVALSIPAFARPARALVQETPLPPPSPMQYDVEQIMQDQDELVRRVRGLERSNTILTMQLFLTGSFAVFTRR
jgi:hypothetical protein